MNLYLLRHGEAIPPNGTISDNARTLSDRGRNDIEGAARLLSRLSPSVTRIVTSPLVRAGQTGEILRGALPWHPTVSQSENLSPGFRRAALLEELAGMNEQDIVAVGHQPDLTGLISYLISGPLLALEMDPGSLAALTVTNMPGGPTGRLRWLLNPGLIRSLNGNQ